MSVLFYDRIFPFVFPSRGNKSRLLKTNILTIRKNRDASNNETRQFEAKLSKNRSRRRYFIASGVHSRNVFQKDRDIYLRLI